MTAPQRLIDADDEFDRELIRSAHDDRPSHRALERMLLGLGVELPKSSSAASSSAASTTTSGKMGAAVLAKWLVTGVSIGLATIGGAEVVGRALEHRDPGVADPRKVFVRPAPPLAASAQPANPDL